MKPEHPNGRGALTLVEIVLVVTILVAIAGLVIPNFARELERDRLPRSARQFRSLLAMVRANAAFDCKRYRIRFPQEDELDPLGGDRQPLIEREDDPMHETEVFNLVTAPWAVGKTFLKDIWCAEVRLERPTIERLRDRLTKRLEQSAVSEALEEAFEEFEPNRPPLLIEADGATEWVTFVLTDAPPGTDPDEIAALEDAARIEVIMEGRTGSTWLQRPLYEEELDEFEDKRRSPVLRIDFLDPRVIVFSEEFECLDDEDCDEREACLLGGCIRR